MVKRTLILIIALALFLGTSSSFGAYEWVLLDGELNIPRHGLTGEALNGYVYAIGGIISGGTAPSDSQNAVSRYNSATDNWTLVDSMTTARHSLSSAVIEGWIYAVGGHVVNSRSENQRYNGTSWESRASVYARSSPGVAAYNGELYVFGGNRYATILSRVDIYDPDTDTWRSGCEMPAATCPGRAVTLGDIIYVNYGDDPKELWAYDPVGCTWDTLIPLMNVSRGNYELQAVNGRIYAIGGSNASEGYLSSVESWAPGDTSWRIEPSLKIARNHFASAVIGNDIYIFGGYNGGDLGSTEVLTLCEPPEEGPYISSIEPPSGAPGIDVTIKGFEFPSFPMVNFGGKLIPVPWGSWSENEVVVKVPSGKGVVDVSLSTITGVVLSNSVKFTYKDPVIDYIDPSSGRAGENVTISGKDFGYKDLSPFFWVKFGKTTSVTTSSWTDTEIEAESPIDFGTGISDILMLVRIIKYAKLGWLEPVDEVIKKIITDKLIDLFGHGVRIPLAEGKIEVDVKVITGTENESNAKVFTYDVIDIDLLEIILLSPGELRVYDSQGNVTGLVNGEMREEIPDSGYESGTVTILNTSGSYYYEVAGTGQGTYGLNITSVSDVEAVTFEATNIPTSSGAVHQYNIDWGALSAGEEGVILEIDNNGDGFFEQMVIADNELSYDEFALQTETVVDFDPDTLNLKSKGKFVTVYIELPEDFDVSEINLFSLALNELVPPLPKPIEIGDYDSDGINDLMVKFDLQELIEVLEPGEQIIDLTGRLLDGRPLAGFDFIRVIH